MGGSAEEEEEVPVMEAFEYIIFGGGVSVRSGLLTAPKHPMPKELGVPVGRGGGRGLR